MPQVATIDASWNSALNHQHGWESKHALLRGSLHASMRYVHAGCSRHSAACEWTQSKHVPAAAVVHNEVLSADRTPPMHSCSTTALEQQLLIKGAGRRMFAARCERSCCHKRNPALVWCYGTLNFDPTFEFDRDEQFTHKRVLLVLSQPLQTVAS